MSKDLTTLQIFTTKQVADVCRVATRTVMKWFDAGRLRGYRIPGSLDRRIPRESLIDFMRQHGFPMNILEEKPLEPIEGGIERMIREDMEVVFSGKPLSELTESQLELRKLVDKMVTFHR